MNDDVNWAGDLGFMEEQPDLAEGEDADPPYKEEVVLSEDSDLETYGPFDPVMRDKGLHATFVEFILPAELEAIAEMDGNCAPNHIGVRAYQLRTKLGSEKLGSEGWERENYQGQIRFVKRQGYPNPVRIICVGGWKQSGGFCVHPKGTTTRIATEENNRSWSGQLTLFEELEQHEELIDLDEAFQNYYIYVDRRPLLTGDWWITIRIGLPNYLNGSGRRMETICEKAIFDAPLGLGSAASTGRDLPPPEDASPSIDDLI